MIRKATINDAAQIVDIYNYYIKNTTITFEYDTLSPSDFANRISNISKAFPYYVYEQDSIVRGYAYASNHGERPAYGWNAVLSVYIDKDYRGNGIGKKLYDAVISDLKDMGYINVYAVITSPNEKSEQFHKNYGFTHFATFENTGYKLNTWLDVVWYKLMLTDTLPLNPTRPITTSK